MSVANEVVRITVDTRVATDIRVQANRPDIVVHDKKRKQITLIEIGITSQSRLQTVEVEKTHKYDLLASEMAAIYKCELKIIAYVIPYVMTWEGVVTKHHQRHSKALGLTPRIEAYIQAGVLRKTLESISHEYRRAFHAEGAEELSERLIKRMQVEHAGEEHNTQVI